MYARVCVCVNVSVSAFPPQKYVFVSIEFLCRMNAIHGFFAKAHVLSSSVVYSTRHCRFAHFPSIYLSSVSGGKNMSLCCFRFEVHEFWRPNVSDICRCQGWHRITARKTANGNICYLSFSRDFISFASKSLLAVHSRCL